MGHHFPSALPELGISSLLWCCSVSAGMEVKLLMILLCCSPGSGDGHDWGHAGPGGSRPQGVQLQHPHQAFPVLLPGGEPGCQLLLTQGLLQQLELVRVTRPEVHPVQQEPPLPFCSSPPCPTLLLARSGCMTSHSMSTVLTMCWSWALTGSGMSPTTRRWLVW